METKRDYLAEAVTDALADCVPNAHTLQRAMLERDALRSEVGRLRESLQLVVKECGPNAGLDYEPGAINTVSRIARAALNGGGK